MIKIKYSKEESKKIFFTSDTHYCHNNIIRYCNRPFNNFKEMDEVLISKWNNKVPPDGIVFHLGDFCFAGSDKWKEIVSQLNGHIILIKGNHDHVSKGMEALFDYVSLEMSIEIDKHKVYLNHYPFLTYAGAYNSKPVIQLFGHVHSNSTNADSGRLKYLFPTQYDVGVDNNNYVPISWDEVLNKIDEQCKRKKSMKLRILNLMEKILWKIF